MLGVPSLSEAISWVFVIRYSPINDIKLSLFKYFSLRPFDALSVLQRLITQIKSLRRLLIPLVQMEKKDVKPRILSSCLSLWKYERLAVFDKNSSLNSHSRLNIKVGKSKPPLPRSIEHIKFWLWRKVLRRLRGWFDASLWAWLLRAPLAAWLRARFSLTS